MNAPHSGLPATVEEKLDQIADEVLALARKQERRDIEALRGVVLRSFGVAASAAQLDEWLAHRIASDFRAANAPAIRSTLDVHLRLINKLRDPDQPGGLYTWEQVMACLKAADPSFDASLDTLRSWHSRRSRRGAKLSAAAKNSAAGHAASLQNAPAAPLPSSIEDAEPPTAAPVAPARLAPTAGLADELARINAHNESPNALGSALARLGVAKVAV